jgi:hypothetical protein
MLSILSPAQRENSGYFVPDGESDGSANIPSGACVQGDLNDPSSDKIRIGNNMSTQQTNSNSALIPHLSLASRGLNIAFNVVNGILLKYTPYSTSWLYDPSTAKNKNETSVTNNENYDIQNNPSSIAILLPDSYEMELNRIKLLRADISNSRNSVHRRLHGSDTTQEEEIVEEVIPDKVTSNLHNALACDVINQVNMFISYY